MTLHFQWYYSFREGQVARALIGLECYVTSLGHSACLVAISKMSKHSSCFELDDESDEPDKHDKTKNKNNKKKWLNWSYHQKVLGQKILYKIYKTWALEIKCFFLWTNILCYFCHKGFTTFGVMQYVFLIVEGYLLHEKHVWCY